MGIKEILAAKKAAQEAAASTNQAAAPVAGDTATGAAPSAEPVEAGKAQVAQTPVASSVSPETKIVTEPTVSSTVKTEQTSAEVSVQSTSDTQPQKPLSFKEKMALARLKGLPSTAPAPTSGSGNSVLPSGQNEQKQAPKSESISASTVSPSEDKSPVSISPLAALAADPQHAEPVKPSVLSSLMATTASALLADVSTAHVGPEIEQPVKVEYVALATKIRQLTAASEDKDLENAMSSLKKALYENPAASALLLPEEIGALVIGLRRMVGEQILANVKEPKEKKDKAAKIKATPLTQEQLDSAWEEL